MSITNGPVSAVSLWEPPFCRRANADDRPALPDYSESQLASILARDLERELCRWPDMPRR